MTTEQRLKSRAANKTTSLRTKLVLVFKLGIINVLRVLSYKLKLKYLRLKKLPDKSESPTGTFYYPVSQTKRELSINTSWRNNHCFFGYLNVESHQPPQWHENVLTGEKLTNQHQPWYKLSDFSENQGDIKGIWEASRFDWVLAFAQYAAEGDSTSLTKLNLWLNDWVKHNPPLLGVNWKCGQESSIRVLRLCLAALILDQTERSSENLVILIQLHLERISSTLSYAIAQDNNHGTSEAAALYIGGNFLENNGVKLGGAWHLQGKKWLKNRALKLIEADGSFSQYSTTYHRLMLDTFSLVEVWRLHHQLENFNNRYYKRLSQAALWLYTMTQKDSGDAPNLGSNDGANLLPLTTKEQRDFRPSVQLASALFNHNKAYGCIKSCDDLLSWLKVKIPYEMLPKKQSTDFENGGYATLIQGEAFALLRYPNYQFRPHQNDNLHVDFWYKGENLLRDGGTYSYNHSAQKSDYYNGIKSHNSVEFDQHDPMPRVSRFLLSNWSKTHINDLLIDINGVCKKRVGYQDTLGCKHVRTVTLTAGSLIVEDSLSDFESSAVLRWRLQPDDWHIDKNKIFSENYCIEINSNVTIKRISIVEGFESRYYYTEATLPVIEVEIETSGKITTTYNYNK